MTTPDTADTQNSVAASASSTAAPKQDVMKEIKIPGEDAINSSEAVTKNTPAASSGMQQFENQRGDDRYHVHWHVTVKLESGDAHQGVIRDISVNGATLYLEHNLHNANKATLDIHIPLLNVGEKPHSVEVHGKIAYMIYDSDEPYFRCGFSFTQFNVDTDRTYLHSRLIGYHSQVK